MARAPEGILGASPEGGRRPFGEYRKGEEQRMDAKFKDSRTLANIMSAYAGESQAYTKYRIMADKAKKDGYEQIAAIFEETARNEKTHAGIWLEYIHGGQLKETKDNLKDAQAGEHFEWTEMYKNYAEEAKREGYTEIASRMELIAKVEKDHDERYGALIQNLENSKVFKKDGQQVWICRNCGYIHVGDAAPMVCPLCRHPQAFFELKAENY